VTVSAVLIALFADKFAEVVTDAAGVVCLPRSRLLVA